MSSYEMFSIINFIGNKYFLGANYVHQDFINSVQSVGIEHISYSSFHKHTELAIMTILVSERFYSAVLAACGMDGPWV